MQHSNEVLSKIRQAEQAVRKHTDKRPSVALVLGSGLGSYAATLANPTIVPYEAIPSMPQSAVSGHAGNLVLGEKSGKVVVAMQGRAHLYEGHCANDVVFGVRLMHALGARGLIITNAAGGVNREFNVGDLMLISDHLNLTGTSSLLGPNDESLGPRFVDMTRAYDAEWMSLADDCAKQIGFSMPRGVYAGLLGPAYETPAEVNMVRVLGADAVGMSTVLEVLAARHLGMRVVGISCITNKAAGITGEALNHDEVKDVAAKIRTRFSDLIDRMIGAMNA
ncbi:MAG: purine-nucleoside phosphorylase [Polyangiales bacterium]